MAQNPYPWADGEILYAEDLNAVSMSLIASDSTAGSTTSATYVQLGSTVNIPANTVEDHVIIIVRCGSFCEAQGPSSGGASTSSTHFKIVVDSTDRLELTPFSDTTGPVYSSQNTYNSTSMKEGQYIIFYYTPSASEKTNGFAVKFYGKVASSGAGATSATCYYDSLEVFGG